MLAVMVGQLAYEAEQQTPARAQREAEVEAQRVALLERLWGRVVEVITSRDHGSPIKVRTANRRTRRRGWPGETRASME